MISFPSLGAQMLTVLPSKERGHADHGWLETFHTFSFASYYDRAHMGFRSLRVINQDKVQGGYGFDMHPHQDVEVITYMLEGLLEHKDSLGKSETMKPGDVQKISAGTGILHSEYNASEKEDLRLMQIWIIPNQKGVKPSHIQATFKRADKLNRWCLIVSPQGEKGSLPLYQDAKLWAAILEPGKSLEYKLDSGRGAWLQVIRGKLTLNHQPLEAGDGASLEKEKELVLSASQESEVLLFDLA